jgi:hypothetical protein
MRKCHEAAYVAAFLQAAPTMVDTTELVNGDDVHTAGAFHAQMKDIYGPGPFDGGKVDLRRWLDNAPAEDHAVDAVPSMQQELVATINSIKGKAQAALEAVNELKRRAGEEKMAMPAILEGDVERFCDGSGKPHIQAKIMSAV